MEVISNPPTDYRGRVIEKIPRGKEGLITNPLWLTPEARAIQKQRYAYYSEAELMHILMQNDINRYAGEPSDILNELKKRRNNGQ